MIVGIGTDLVGVARFEAALRRTPALAERIFAPAELTTWDGLPRPVESLAARYAAKEAARKALGAPPGSRLADCTVVSDVDGRPALRVSGGLAEAAAALGVTGWHVSLTHDDGTALAFVLAECS